jgi:phosphatidylserine/phosphatidylglycerophosphate/cardiolipin synthase-like enzyme
MDEIITHLKQSISDDILSKPEKKSFRELISQRALSQEQVNFLSHAIFEMANEKATEANYRFILEWMHGANGVLGTRHTEKASVFFSPGDSCRNAIIDQINKAISSLRICVFTISDDNIADAITTAHKRGVNVKIITDNDKSFDLGSDIVRLAKANIPVKMDNTPDHMHHKFMVIDETKVLTGSYNWTRSAARVNHENIILTGEEGVVKSFLNEFDRLWKAMDLHLK